jgi:DNA-binding response OmpR family regulator
MKLLIVDTDRDLAKMLSSWLRTLGYEVHCAYTGERAKIDWEKYQPNLVILDTALKDVDGLAMCREMQDKYDALVLVIASTKNVQDEICCLESGADDYLLKPFYPAQLLARIHALNRRVRPTLIQHPHSIISVGPICVDASRNIVSVDGKTSRLTVTESKLLHLLAINANNVCTANQIVSHIWGFDEVGDPSLIKGHIRHLRQKIEPDPSKPYYILTVSGVGYTLIRRSTEDFDSKKQILFLNTKETDDPYSALSQ